MAAGFCLRDKKHDDEAVTWVNVTLMQLFYPSEQEEISVGKQTKKVPVS